MLNAFFLPFPSSIRLHSAFTRIPFAMRTLRVLNNCNHGQVNEKRKKKYSARQIKLGKQAALGLIEDSRVL